MSATQQENTEVQSVQDKCPHATTLKNAATLGIKQDKPLMLDYYLDSYSRKCKLVKTQDKDTILYKSNEEYTSPLKKLFKIDGSKCSDGTCDVIAISENSIYIVHSNIIGK
tara:strand:+ start:1044 stop:1376 length:333 start_codon:yes stop_codon:yes gene_type:complete